MKKIIFPFTTIILTASCLMGDSTISSTDKHAYGANFGWVNFRHDQPSSPEGDVVNEHLMSGYIYSANCGWIHLGDGTPDNGIAYSNSSSTDYGVNHDGNGNLTGYAYAANIGWIQFEQTYGKPYINLSTGQLSGSMYSANCGWITLDGGTASVISDTLGTLADSDADDLPDFWELTTAGDLTTMDQFTDTDGDKQTDLSEYLTATNPNDGTDIFAVSSYQPINSNVDFQIEWTSSPNRLYYIEKSSDMNNWMNAGGPYYEPTDPSISAMITETLTEGVAVFFRVKAEVPLGP